MTAITARISIETSMIPYIPESLSLMDIPMLRMGNNLQ